MTAIVLDGHPALAAVCASFDFAQHNPTLLAAQLTQAMRAARGLGCAAPQLAVRLRAFVLEGGREGAIACFNPRILVRMDGEERVPEGCLSFPGVFVHVRRARRVRVRFQDVAGDVVEREFAGLMARAFQHELDHLDGRTLRELVPAQAFALARARAAAHTP